MRRAARGTLGLVAVVLGLSACEAAEQENEARHTYEASSDAACDASGKAPKIKGHPSSKRQNSDGIWPPQRPTWVDLGLEIPAITAINELDNAFQIEGFMTLVWCDPRLKDTMPQAQERIFLERKADEKLGDIWWPDLAFVDGMAAANVQNEALRIDRHGTVKYEQRFDVLLQADYRLERFPFDHQTLDIEIESFAWPENDLRLLQKKATSVVINVPPEWRSGAKTRVIRNEIARLIAEHDRAVSALEGVKRGPKLEEAEASAQSAKEQLDLKMAGRPTFSNFNMSIAIARKSGFYYAKLIVPLVLIVGISWAVFWAKPKDMNDRVALTFTAILTIVAFQFLISDQLPRVSYQTFMDRLLLTSFGFMICTGVESVIVNILFSDGRGTVAAAIDRNCRWAFPLGYVTVLAVISAATFWF